MDVPARSTVTRQPSRCALGFYRHLVLYLVLNISFLTVKYVAEIFIDGGAANIWSWWWTIGWGIGLAAHAAWVYLFRRQCGLDLAERSTRNQIVEEPRT